LEAPGADHQKEERERSDRKGGDKFAGETKRKASGAATGGQWASREESAAAELRGDQLASVAWTGNSR